MQVPCQKNKYALDQVDRSQWQFRIVGDVKNLDTGRHVNRNGEFRYGSSRSDNPSPDSTRSKGRSEVLSQAMTRPHSVDWWQLLCRKGGLFLGGPSCAENRAKPPPFGSGDIQR